jgi:hypothetical protein
LTVAILTGARWNLNNTLRVQIVGSGYADLIDLKF